ncbi:MAG: ergothioneine biosynthesis protein EgtB [Comamonadaceae bacterium]|nr:MAG: ergothioneine biosynthesis protein EgtB [Comamonadaceae bacterium]
MPSVSPSMTPASIDSPDMRRAGRELLSLALMDARNHTLDLLASHEAALQAARSAKPGVAPAPVAPDASPLWLAGHVGWFAEYWIGRNTQRSLGPACPPEPTRLASIEPRADGWWSPALVGQAVALPDSAATRAWLLETLESTLELLEKTADEDSALYFFRLALFHEDMCGERLVVMAQTLGHLLKLDQPAAMQGRQPLLVPAGRWSLGSKAGGFVFDNEMPAHDMEVPEFEIDAHVVSWQQYAEFVEDGGYDREEFWQPPGWTWLQEAASTEGRRGPRYVEQIGGAGGAVLQTRFGRNTRMAGGQPAMHMTWWEADAWCRWAGRRLPTEVEWEMAVSTASRRGLRWGDVMEWTASTFRPWPGFSTGPWAGYSEPWFGRAKAVRGASFATRARMKSPKFRSFAMPDDDEGFVGFRSCTV